MIVGNLQHLAKNRRGISSIVGTLIFTVLMIAGFSVWSLAIDTQTDIVNTHLVIADSVLKKQQEQFDFSPSTNSSNFLNVSVNNKSHNPLEISRMWIINKTLTDAPATQIEIKSNDGVIASGSSVNIVENLPLYITPNIYDIKLISSLGTIKTKELIADSTSNVLRAKLFTDPPDVGLGENVTIAMYITNSGSETIQNVIPVPGSIPGAVTASSLPTPASVTLRPGESTLFSWEYTIDGAEGQQVSFSGSANGTILGGGPVTSNDATDMSTLREDEVGSGTNNNNFDVVFDELLAQPKLFVTVPSPNGDSNQQSLWGITIANPIGVPMKISKLSILALAPSANGNHLVWASNCGTPTNVKPVGTSYWSCPAENSVIWQNFADPIVIPPYGTEEFLVRLQPGTIAGSSILESIHLMYSVFTDVGSFGKTGYQTVMWDGTDVLSNVYLSNVVDSINDVDMNSARKNIPPASTQTFKMVLADLDSSASTYIKAGASLIINVPPDWTNVQVIGNYGFVDPPTIISNGDGSTQIRAITTGAIGTSGNQADTLEFSAVAPGSTVDEIYLMYTLAQGQTANDFQIGPLSEIVLHVDAP